MLGEWCPSGRDSLNLIVFVFVSDAKLLSRVDGAFNLRDLCRFPSALLSSTCSCLDPDFPFHQLVSVACIVVHVKYDTIPAYAPQQGCPEVEKGLKKQSQRATRQAESVVIGGDLHGRVGMGERDATSHSNRGIGERNDKGYRIVRSGYRKYVVYEDGTPAIHI